MAEIHQCELILHKVQVLFKTSHQRLLILACVETHFIPSIYYETSDFSDLCLDPDLFTYMVTALTSLTFLRF